MTNIYDNLAYEDYVIHANAYIGAIRGGIDAFDAHAVETYAAWLKEMNDAKPDYAERYMNGE